MRRTRRRLPKLAKGPEVLPVSISRRAREAAPGLLLAGLFGLLVGCTSSSPTCAELEVAADRQGCPERVVMETIETFDAEELIERLGPIEKAPDLEAAELEEPTVKESLEALIRDLKATRSWGWRLFDQLQDLERAIAELEAEPD